MRKLCFIATGRSKFLCPMHRQAAIALAAKWNIDRETAIFELRDFERDVEDARSARARELESAIRTIREHRALGASRRSRRRRARG
jgi:hypothetical protein